MPGRWRLFTRRWPRFSLVAALVMLAALSVLLKAPALAAPPSDPPAQGGVVVSAVDNDPDNKLWECTVRRAPFGNQDINMLRCFTFRYQVPPQGVTSAILHVAVKALPDMPETDSLVVAVGQPYAECDWARGGMPGCVTLHGGIRGNDSSLNLDLLNMACDPSVQGSPEAQQALLTQLQTGVLHFMLQDDTAVYSAQLVLNGSPATFPCGTSEQPWTPPSPPSLADQISQLVTGSPWARAPGPAAAAGAAAAATAALGAYAVLNGALGRTASGGAPAASRANQAAGARTPGEGKGAPDTRGADGSPERSPANASPGTEGETISESDLRDALDKFKDHIEDLAGIESGPGARLVVKEGRASKQAVALSSGPVTIGRHASNTLALEDASVSRHHATVKFESGAWMLADMNSANGTYVNGTRVTQCALRPGDQIRIGPVTLVFEGAAAAPSWRCGRCGRTNAAQDRFCGSCGTGRP